MSREANSAAEGSDRPHFLDARIDAGNEGAGQFPRPRVSLFILVERTAIEEEPGSLVEGTKAGPKTSASGQARRRRMSSCPQPNVAAA